MTRRLLPRATIGIAAVVLAACSTLSDDKPPRTGAAPPPLALNYIGSNSQLASHLTENWWREFDDAVLSELVERALAQNLDVRMSLARVDAARALSRGARAAGRPEIDV